MNYITASHTLAQMDTDLDAAELQGVAYSFICLNDDKAAKALWAQFLAEEFEDILESDQDFLALCGQIYTECDQAVKRGDYGITLCLPDEEEALSERVIALCAWCKGFMYGLGIAGQPEVLKEPEIQEALEDLAQMVHVELDHEHPEGDETAFFELVEYARLIPAMIYEHAKTHSSTEKTLH